MNVSGPFRLLQMGVIKKRKRTGHNLSIFVGISAQDWPYLDLLLCVHSIPMNAANISLIITYALLATPITTLAK